MSRTNITKAASRAGKGLVISLDVPRKAVRIFNDYVRDLYFPAQRLSRWERFRCTPLLLFVEYLVYRVDTVAENTRDLHLAVAGNTDYQTLRRYKVKFESLLRRARAHNETVGHQLDYGEEYVRLENAVTASRSVTHAQVLRLAELRPSDVRLLHAMTYAQLGRPVDGDLLDLLWPVEVLADLANDLDHYHSDVAAGRLNTYHAFVQLYGHSAPDRLRAEIHRYEEHFRTRLAAFPADRQDELMRLCTRRYRPRTDHIPAPLLNTLSPA